MTAQAPTSTPFRQCRNPRRLLVLNPRSPRGDAQTILARVRELSRARGCSAYLFVDGNGWAYVVSEEAQVAHRWAIEHTDWWRGCFGYTATTEDVLREIDPFR